MATTSKPKRILNICVTVVAVTTAFATACALIIFAGMEIVNCSRCSIKTDAIVADLTTQHILIDAIKREQPIFKYQYNGTTYQHPSRYANGKYQPGQRVWLYVNPEQPEQSYLQEGLVKTLTTIGIINVAFIVIAILIIFNQRPLKRIRHKPKHTKWAQQHGGKYAARKTANNAYKI